MVTMCKIVRHLFAPTEISKVNAPGVCRERVGVKSAFFLGRTERRDRAVRLLDVSLLVVLSVASCQVLAQIALDAAGVGGAREPPEWRSTAGYPFPALADTVARMQNVAHAMRLRDYCADRRVPDEFVRARLQRFSQLTGREETCTTLLDY